MHSLRKEIAQDGLLVGREAKQKKGPFRILQEFCAEIIREINTWMTVKMHSKAIFLPQTAMHNIHPTSCVLLFIISNS